MTDDKQLAGWILDLVNAGADCRRKLGAIRDLQHPTEAAAP